MIILMFFMVLHLRDDSPPRAERFSATCRRLLLHVADDDVTMKQLSNKIVRGRRFLLFL